MESKSHVIPIILIVVVLVALVSTYSWFSTETDTEFVSIVSTGMQTLITISNINATNLENQYSGQKGYKLENGVYVPFTGEDADVPYNVYLNHSYTAAGDRDSVVTFTLSKAVITFPSTLSRNLAWVLQNSFNVDTTGFTSSDYAKYLSSSEANVPTGNTSGFYADGNSTSSLTKIVILSSAVNNYFFFDYWAVSSMVDQTAGTAPINLVYGTTLANSGVTNYVRLHLGYYGKVLDPTYENQYGQYVMPFAFNATAYSGSTFAFTVSVEAK